MVYIIIEWLSIFVDYAKYGFSCIPDILKKYYSIWKYAIAQYNMKNGYINRIEGASKIKMNDIKNFETDPLPIDLPIPDYMKL